MSDTPSAGSPADGRLRREVTNVQNMPEMPEGRRRTLERYRVFHKTPPRGGILFAGSSLMEMFPVERFAAERGIMVYNRGVSGLITDELLALLNVCVLDLRPSKLFINIGTNDLSRADRPIATVMKRYGEILARVREAVPEVVIYVMAYYPVNYDAASDEIRPNLRIRTNEKIDRANRELQVLARKYGARYIDVNAPLKDPDGNLRAEYTIEGMHIREEGYRAIYPLVERYILES